MGTIRKAFKIKNTIRHPIHAATRPVRRTVRKAVVPKSARKAYYKTKTVSTAVHNPISTSIRSLDGISTSTKRRKSNLYSDTSRERKRLYRELQHFSKTAGRTSSLSDSSHSSLPGDRGRLNRLDSVTPDTKHASSAYDSKIYVNHDDASSVDSDAEFIKTIPAFFMVLIFLIVIGMCFIEQYQDNKEKADTIREAYSACQTDNLQLTKDHDDSPSIKGEDVSPQTVSCLAEHMGIEDTFTPDKEGGLQERGDYRMLVYNFDPSNVVSSKEEYSVEITFQRS